MSRIGALKRGASRLGKPAAAMIAAAAAAVLSCGFIGTDMFPRELQYAAGDYDLAGEHGCAPDEIGELNIELLRSLDSATGVFAAARRPDGWHLTILDGRMDRIASLKEPSFSRFLGSYAGGDSFICGRTSIAGDYTLGSAGTMAGCRDDCFDVPMTNFIIEWRGVSSSLVYLGLKAGGGASAVETPLVSGAFFKPLDTSALFVGSGTPRFFLLARGESGNGGDALCLGFPDASASLEALLNGTPLASNAQIEATWIHTDYVDGGWATDDGIVLLVRGRDTRLARFDFGTGTELDSLRVDSEWMQAPCFEASGDYWYYYDRGSGRIKRLRTWWR